MAGMKDNVVVAVIGDLTSEQAGQIIKDVMKSKRKYAPNGRGTIASGKKGEVGGLLQGTTRKGIGKKA